MEVLGIVCGVVNSAYTTFGEEFPKTLIGFLPAIAMMVLPATEALRIPLASQFYKKQIKTRILAVLVLAGASYVAIENYSIAFVRIFDMRVGVVMKRVGEYDQASAALAGAQRSQEEQTKKSSSENKIIAEGIISPLDADIKAFDGQIQQESARHTQELAAIIARCKLTRRGDGCLDRESKRENEINRSNLSELAKKRNDKISERDTQKKKVGEDIVLEKKRSEIVETNIEQLREKANLAQREVQIAEDANVLYNLATSWFHTKTMTPEQFATARWWFSTVAAAMISLAAMMSALVHYAPDRIPDEESFKSTLMAKVARARRQYYARKRKPLIRNVPGPIRYKDRYVVVPERHNFLANVLNAVLFRKDMSQVTNFDGKPDLTNIVQIDKDKRAL